MVAFQAAADCGAPYFELDVHMTCDGEIVVHHDPDLARTCGQPADIRALTWNEVGRADAGHEFTSDRGGSFPFRGKNVRVPLLTELFASFPRQRMLIEIKQESPSLVEPLLRLIDASQMRRRVAVVSELQRPVDEVRAVAPHLPTNLPYGEIIGFMQALAARDRNYRPRGNALQVPPEYEGWKLAMPEIIGFAHEVGLQFDVWTVNDEAEMRALLDAGVDGIITDYPSRMLGLLRNA